MSFAIAIFSLAFANVFLPIFSAWLVCRPEKTLRRKSFHQKWGILYEDYKSKNSKWVLALMLIFFLRRMIFVLVAFYMEKP